MLQYLVHKTIYGNKLKEYTGIIQQQELEKLLFGTSHYLDRNVFVTSHQIANVYTRPAAHYEVRCDEKSIDIQVDDLSEGDRLTRNDVVIESNPINSKNEEDNIVTEIVEELKSTKKIPSFGLTKLGEYSVGLVGKAEDFLPFIKKYGGYKSSKRMVYEKTTYSGGYIIPYYNLERFLQSLRAEGWDISKLATSIGFTWLLKSNDDEK